MNKNALFLSIFILCIVGIGALIYRKNNIIKKVAKTTAPFEENVNPLSIQSLRNGKYNGSDIVIEQTLEPGSNYKRYIASYKSEGLKIYALLTVPSGENPPAGG